MELQRVEKKRWRELTRTFADHNFRCLWEFGTASAARIGGRTEHVALFRGDEALSIADVRIKRIPLLQSGIAYVNGGPLVRRDGPGNRERLEASLRGLRGEYVDRRGLVLRVAPPLGPPEWNRLQEEVFRSLGFERAGSAAPYRTIVLDITPPLEEIRLHFNKKWRWHLTQAQKRAPTLRAGDGDDLFDAFIGLFRQFIQRKGFHVDLDASFYARVQEQLPEADRFHVCLAEIDGRVVAGQVSSILGDTCVYLLGASSDVGREHFAPYLLQWHTLQEARARSCRAYDLGGIDPEENPGVYTFKKRMGGVDLTAAGPFETAPGGPGGQITLGAERLYRLAQRLWRRRPAP